MHSQVMDINGKMVYYLTPKVTKTTPMVTSIWRYIVYI